MNHSAPIFTADAECQDCFKCVRHCPVKAIKVEGGHASVIPELCLACGHCVEVCPSHAKKIRKDLSRARQLVAGSNPVYVSLAPSWVSEFRGLSAGKMIAAIKKLGFAGVSETALGAQAVSAQVAQRLQSMTSGIMISSACPVIVDLVRKYMPAFTECISPVYSPALTHAKMLREKLGEDIKVVFVGPCVAKKNEADRNPELIQIAMLYPRLRQWFKEENIDPYRMDEGPNDKFVMDVAQEGALYPVEGGMNDTIKAHGGCDHVNFTFVSGIVGLQQALNGLVPSDVKEPVFIEALSCPGGCVHGPGTEHNSSGLIERLRIIRAAKIKDKLPEREPVEIDAQYTQDPMIPPPISLYEIKKALLSVGKTKPEDELNCGGCGYDTCANFARALVAGKAEPNMCVSYLRNLTLKKSSAMLRCIPAAVVIVDRNLRLVECNRRFAEFAGDDAVQAYDVSPGMSGGLLRKLVSFPELFEQVLRTGEEVHREMFRSGKRLIDLRIFNVEPGQVVGAMLFDVTGTEYRREQIAERAREVIEKNLATVQDIACKLGEHMAETEILLRSIAEDYADD